MIAKKISPITKSSSLLSHFSFNPKIMIASILLVALISFELFNFDTTRYALTNLLGTVSFLGISWAAILSLAFCSIDFAGLAYLFSGDTNNDGWHDAWYLTAAWLLGATMNAIMSWWAVSLTLLDNPIGNEVMSREALLRFVPIFVAVLVWLTRILFIGALSIAGDKLFNTKEKKTAARTPVTLRPLHHTADTITPDPNKPTLITPPGSKHSRRPSSATISATGKNR